MAASISFQSLPTELQCSIIRYLDPIALISLSQTSSGFWKLISPTKTHLIERLLALELTEEHGGPGISVSRFGTLDPDKHSPEWEGSRWACSECLRLLPHYAFPNKALATLPYRKPLRQSAQDQRITSWEPTDENRKRGRKSSREIRDEYSSPDEINLRTRYGRMTTRNWGFDRCDWNGVLRPPEAQRIRLLQFQDCGIEAFTDMEFSEFEQLSESKEIELLERERNAVIFLRAGWNRRVRRCNECRFQRGELRGAVSRWKGLGSLKTPITVGREKWYGTVVDRYFPNVSDVLETERPPFNAPVFAIYNEDRRERLWASYRVRCRGCAHWKELRAFRVGAIYPRWKPCENGWDRSDQYRNWDEAYVDEEFLDGLRCNHCYIKEHGRKALGEELVKWLELLAEKQRGEFAGSLTWGHRSLTNWSRDAPKHLKRKVRGLVWDLKSLLDRESSDVTRTDLALLRIRREEYMTMGEEVKDWLPHDSGFIKWIDCYDESEAMWLWLKELGEEIREEGKADVLADWALKRDEIACS